MIRVITNHKIEAGGILGSSYHLSGVNSTPPIQSLKQIPLFDTGLSLAVCVEIVAAFCVVCLLVKYAYEFYCWVKAKRNG
jgi:hypothetical protein